MNDFTITMREMKRPARRKFNRWLTNQMRVDGYLTDEETVSLDMESEVEVTVDHLIATVPGHGIVRYEYNR